MGDFHQHGEAITLEQYREMEAAGKIRRPLTLGHIEPHRTLGDYAVQVFGMGEMALPMLTQTERTRNRRARLLTLRVDPPDV